MHFHHSASADDLYRRVIEDEVDRLQPDLDPDKRNECIRKVSDMMDSDIEEHLAGASLRPELLTVRLREAVALVMRGDSPSLAV